MSEGFNFSKSLPMFAIACLFYYIHPCECEVALICISLITNDTVHLFLGLLATCISPLEKCLFRSFARFSIGFLPFYVLSCKSSLCTLDTSPSSDIQFTNIFSHTVGYLFTFLVVWIHHQICNFDEVIYLFCHCCLYFWCHI